MAPRMTSGTDPESSAKRVSDETALPASSGAADGEHARIVVTDTVGYPPAMPRT
jgi:hypothetical protein